jgi:hypothetical protein
MEDKTGQSLIKTPVQKEGFYNFFSMKKEKK